MPANFEVWIDTAGTDGAPGTIVTLSGNKLKFRADDLNTDDTTNPVPIVTGLTKYSWARAVYLKCITTPPTSYCNNFKFYTDGVTFGTGITCSVIDGNIVKNSGSSAGYKQNHGTVGDTATVQTDATVYNTTQTQVFTYTAAAPRTLVCSEASAQIDAANETTDYIVLQVAVIDTATAGTKTNNNFTFQYDEV